MEKSYLECIQKLKQFKELLLSDIDVKRGKLYLTWTKEKSEKIINEKDEDYILKNVVKDTLPSYVITQYTFNKANATIKNIINKNYSYNNGKYIFENFGISDDDVKMLMKYILFKRGNVVWIDFGFNIGNEFGGMHPAVILKNFSNDLFVLPISSKRPSEYIKIEQELLENKITKSECKNRKDAISEIIEIEKINGFRKMIRWSRITRMQKISILRVNFSGTIGTLDGKYMDIIANKISTELGDKKV